MREDHRPAGKIAVALALLLFGLAAAASLAIALGAASPPVPGPLLLRRVATIELPGPAGKRFDYLTIDPQRHYLLSAHLGAGMLHVIDLRTNKVVTTVVGLTGIEGVEVVPDEDKAYTSDWYENRIAIVDLRQMKVTKKLPTEDKPDGLAYAPSFHKVYVSDERARAEAVVDTRQEKIVTTLHFDSETGNVRYDPVAHKMLVNLQDRNQVVEIEPASDREVGRYAVSECRGNHGMALDAEHRRAFLACEDNQRMIVVDLDSHRTLASLPMASGADVIAYDPGLGRIYVACASGAISVFRQDDPGHYRKLGDVPVERKVHSLAVDPETHRVYVPEEQVGGRPASRMSLYEPLPDPVAQ